MENKAKPGPDLKNESTMVNIYTNTVKYQLTVDGLTKSSGGPITDDDLTTVSRLIEELNDPEQSQFLANQLPKVSKP